MKSGSQLRHTLLAAALLAMPLHGPAIADPVTDRAPATTATAPLTLHLGSRGQVHVRLPQVERGPTLDGRLDDAAWRRAAVLDSFTQGVPIEGVPDSLGTQCLVMYDAHSLYVGFRCADEPRHVQAPVTPRDASWQGDYVCVNIDGFGDHQRSQFFCANAAGVEMDGVDADSQEDSDLAPDFLYTAKGSRSARGWEVEMAIPFTSLRFPARDSIAFGFNASRQVKRAASNLFWAPVTRNINSFHAQMGSLDALQGLRPGRNLQLNPVLTTTRRGRREADRMRYDHDPRAGIGLKYGVTSALTADATLSPDFSQVEADAGVNDINQRFAIYFPEKRPFFLEGSEIFATPTNAVYTRRIVDPRFGGKLSGRVGRTSVGAILAADREAGEPEDGIPDAINPYRGHDATAAILRVRRDVLANSFVGVLASAREQRDAYERNLGIDGRINLLDRWSVTFQQLGGWTRGRDYRPVAGADTTGVAYDSIRAQHPVERTSGRSTSLAVVHGSERLDAEVALTRVSPDFAAGLGFVPRADITTLTVEVQPHLLAKHPAWYTGFHPTFELEQTYRYGDAWHAGPLTDNAWELGLSVRMPRGTRAGIGYQRLFTALGGERFPAQSRIELAAISERFEAVRVNLELRAGDNVLFEEAIRGRFWAAEVYTDLRFSEQFDGTLSYLTEADRRAGDDSRYADVAIPRLRLSYQFTKELAARTIVEWSRERRWDTGGAEAGIERRVSLDGLLGYTLRPGTGAYLGYGSILEGDGAGAIDRTRDNLFVKLSYLWQQ